MLKLDPKNTELLAQKQEVLNESIKTTGKKLEELNKIKEETDKKIAEGTEINQENYRALQREIINTQKKYEDLKNEASNWTKVGNTLTSWGKSLDNISEKIGSLGNKLTTTVTAPIAAIAAAGLTYDAQIEKYETAFKTFLGDADAAADAIKNIKEDARRTPFDTTSLVKANQMLISTGVSAEDARADILALGEAVIATGGGNDELTRMASNLQQIKNAGKATAMDIRQFAYAGIDVYGILADYMGKTTEEIKDMDISYEDLTKALKKAGSEGGKYFGAMSNSSETLTGQVSALKSEVQDGVGELTKSLMPVAKKLVKEAREWIKKLDKLSDSQKENIVKIGLMVAAAGPLLKIASSGISIIGKLSNGFGTLTKAISLMKNGIGTATGSAATLAKIMSSLATPTGAVAIAIGAVTAAAVYFATRETEAEKAAKALKEEVDNLKTSMDEANKSIDDTANQEEAHITHAKNLKDQLAELVDENGKVKEGYESRVDFILNQLNDALGTEYKLNGDIIDGYHELRDSIDEVIQKKTAQIKMTSLEKRYTNAIENQEDAVIKLKDATIGLGMSYDDAKERLKEYETMMADPTMSSEAVLYINGQRKELQGLVDTYETAKGTVEQYTNDVNAYTENYALFQEGQYDKIKTSVETSTTDWTSKTMEDIKTSLEENKKNFEIYKGQYEEIGNEASKELMNNSASNLAQLMLELSTRQDDLEKMSPDELEEWHKLVEDISNELDFKDDAVTSTEDVLQGIEDTLGSSSWVSRLVKKATNIAQQINKGFTSKEGWDEHSPSKKMKKYTENYLNPISTVMQQEQRSIVSKATRLAQSINSVFNKDLLDYQDISGNMKTQIINGTKTIFTTPNIVINANDELNPEKINRIIDTVNRRLGSQY